MLITDAKQCVKVFNDWVPPSFSLTALVHCRSTLYSQTHLCQSQVLVEGPFESAQVVVANLKFTKVNFKTKMMIRQFHAETVFKIPHCRVSQIGSNITRLYPRMVYQSYPLDICHDKGPAYKTFVVLLLLLKQLFKTLKTCRDNSYLAFHSSSVLNTHLITVSSSFLLNSAFSGSFGAFDFSWGC